MVDEHEQPERQGGERRQSGAGIPQYVTHIDAVHGTINIGSTVYGEASPPPPPVESPGDAGYDVAAIRRLLLEAFTVQDLARFCRDRPAFRTIVYRFGPNHGLDDMVDEVIQYCSTHFLWSELLAAVREENPGQYARFEAQLRTTPPEPTPSQAPVEILPSAMFDDLHRRVRDHAPAHLRTAAVEQVSVLRAAVAAQPLDLARVQAVWHWFDEKLPSLSGPLLGVVLDLGRRLQAGTNDDLWAEFQERFADYLD